MKSLIRPWYRSRLFWAGLPGLVFLMWAWLAFVQDLVKVSWTIDDGTIEVGSSNGDLFSTLIWPPMENQRHGFSVERLRNYWEGEGDAWTRQPFGSVQTQENSHRERYQLVDLWVAGWFGCLLYLIPWMGAVIGWQRRKSRKSV